MPTAQINVDYNVTFTYNDKPRMGKVVKAEPAYVKVELIDGTVKTFTRDKMHDVIANEPSDIELFP